MYWESMTLKIMIDTSLISVGGGVQVAINLIKNILSDSLFEIILIASPQVSAQLTQQQINQCLYYKEEINEPIWRKKIQGKRLSEIEKKHKPDLVFVIFGPSYWRPKTKTLQGFALPLMVYPETRDRIYKKQKITYFYQKILNTYKAQLMKKNADYVVVETLAFKERVCEFLNIDKNNIFVIENSFNANFLEIKGDKKKNDILNIFIPTAYYPHKNLEILVDVACELVSMQKLNIKFNFLLPENSEPWINIVTSAKQKGVESLFNTYGPVKNIQMAELYHQTDFVLLPTVAEASTAVYPESFISKKVLLTSNIDFAVELCGDAAIYFNPYDAKDIAEKIILITTNPILQQDLIEHGVKQVKSSYLTPESKWLKQKDLIKKLINESL